MMKYRKRVQEVFGISPEILPDSYVDRGQLDAEIKRQLERSNHIALRGESKCGKSWLRKKTIPNSVVVQCRLGRTTYDIYQEILASLGIELQIEKSVSKSLKGGLDLSGEGGKIIAKVGAKLGFSIEKNESGKYQIIGKSPDDIQFVCEVIKESGRKVVIEDFHYMSVSERISFSFDLKTMWDYSTFLVIVGVWSQSNMLIYLNPDLAGRIEEISIYWSDQDLEKVMDQGGAALNIEFSTTFKERIVSSSFANCGILQKLTLSALDEIGVIQEFEEKAIVQSVEAADTAGMKYAEQLNPVYQQFAKRVSTGIRKRADATGIYAHAMAVIMDASDELLLMGFHLDQIHAIANGRQSRIQKGNLRTVLDKFERLQVDDEGRGLVLGFNEATDEIHVVDRQILLYRKFATVKWPWESMVAEFDNDENRFQADNEEFS